jgi:hypothetical protein
MQVLMLTRPAGSQETDGVDLILQFSTSIPTGVFADVMAGSTSGTQQTDFGLQHLALIDGLKLTAVPVRWTCDL